MQIYIGNQKNSYSKKRLKTETKANQCYRDQQQL